MRVRVDIECRRCTYSTCLDHSGGLLNVMNTQLVKMVHMMIILNNVEKSQGNVPIIIITKPNHHYVRYCVCLSVCL